jgi:predicted metal-dependent peptidase
MAHALAYDIETVSEKAAAAMALAKSRLCLENAFFSSIAAKLPFVEVKGLATAATDGINIYYNPEFILGMSFNRRIGLIVHEAGHVLGGHHLRRGNRDKNFWNMATDYAMNQMILDAGFELPEAGLVDAAYSGMHPEGIYEILWASKPPPQEGQQGEPCDDGETGDGQGAGESQPSPDDSAGDDETGNGDDDGQDEAEDDDGNTSSNAKPDDEAEPEAGSWGEVWDCPNDHGQPMTEAETKEALEKLGVEIQQAVNAAKAAGEDIPDAIRQVIEDSRTARSDWREQLRTWVANNIVTDYQWSRPNRRYLSQDIYLPGAVKDGIRTIAILVDTSGSVSNDDLAQAGAEMTQIVEDVQPDLVQVLHVDTRVRKDFEVRPGEEIDLTYNGRGGTDFRPGFQWLEENEIRPDLVIYFTDLESYRYPEEPDYPVLWGFFKTYHNAGTGKTFDRDIGTLAPPFGEVIEIDVHRG